MAKPLRPDLALKLAVIFSLIVVGCGGQTGRSGDAAQAGDTMVSDYDFDAGDGSDEDSGVEVPDVVGEDGADGVSEIEEAGLVATLSGTTDEPDFDPSRDPAGCSVEAQDPGGGESAADGDEITLVLDCRQIDWDNQDGGVWEDFSGAYDDGFNSACDTLFGLSPDGSLYCDDTEYSSIDCTNLEPDPADATDVPSDVPDDPRSEGEELGNQDGCNALFDNEGVTELYWGQDAYTADDCLYALAPAPLTKRHRHRSGAAAPSATDSRYVTRGGPCAPTKIDGTAVVISSDQGRVKCSGAAALWTAYLDNAQNGTGSGSYLELDGWGCIAARPPEAPLQGSCNALDHSAAFSVSTA